MIKSLVAAVALSIGLPGYAFAQEAAHRHHHHHHHHLRQPEPFPDFQAGPPPYLQPAPSSDADNSSIYWSPAGGNPIHYAQTSGYYGGR
jgi:hypothetical protein